MINSDTQRLILMVIFGTSAFLLWNAWEKEHAPPPPAIVKSATTALPAAGQPADVPAPKAPNAAPVPGAVIPGAPPAGAASTGQKIEIKTDLYTAQFDSAGGVLVQLALAQHHDPFDPGKPYLALQSNAERRFIAQSGLRGTGMPNHYTAYEVLPGPRELAPGQDTLELKLRATAANGDKVLRTLTFHRGSYLIDDSYEITNAGTAPLTPSAYFQLTRDTKQAVVQNSMAPASFVGPVVYNEADKFKKIEFGELDKLAADPQRKSPFTKSADNGWIGMIEHYFVAAWLPSDEKKQAREFYTRKLDNGLYAAGVVVDGAPIAPGATGTITVPLYVGPQDQDVLAKTAKGLDLVVDYGVFTIIAAPLFMAARPDRQLGLGDHRDDDHDQGRVLPAQRRVGAFDGQDEDRRAEDEGPAGAVQGRQAAAPDQDDGAVQAGEDQPARRLPADPGADPGVHRAVLGAAVGGRAAARAVDRLDQGSLGAGPVLHPAGDLRDHGLAAGQAVADAGDRSGPAEDLPDHADCVLGAVHLLPGGPGAVLAGEQHAADRPAVAREPDAGEGSRGHRRQAPVTQSAGARSRALR
jgi:YidC/Oxa1 family membrane protein insertase